jgi:hypothetical protein
VAVNENGPALSKKPVKPPSWAGPTALEPHKVANPEPVEGEARYKGRVTGRNACPTKHVLRREVESKVEG